MLIGLIVLLSLWLLYGLVWVYLYLWCLLLAFADLWVCWLPLCVGFTEDVVGGYGACFAVLQLIVLCSLRIVCCCVVTFVDLLVMLYYCVVGCGVLVYCLLLIMLLLLGMMGTV